MWGLRKKLFDAALIQRFIPTYVGFTLRGSPAWGYITVHPHVCGVYTKALAGAGSSTGSSPRMWGLLRQSRAPTPGKRFIPTYVGFTENAYRLLSMLSGSSPRMWGLLLKREKERKPPPVHPHVCGVYHLGQLGHATPVRFIPTYVGFTTSSNSSSPSSHGSSPRMWGLPMTPTCGRAMPAVHPHVCGVYGCYRTRPRASRRFIPTYVGFTTARPDRYPYLLGSSPRMWGLHPGLSTLRGLGRFIPTYVGFTGERRQKSRQGTVHPHVCGVYTRDKLDLKKIHLQTGSFPLSNIHNFNFSQDG